MTEPATRAHPGRDTAGRAGRFSILLGMTGSLVILTLLGVAGLLAICCTVWDVAREARTQRSPEPPAGARCAPTTRACRAPRHRTAQP